MPPRGQGVTLPAASQTSSDLVLPYKLPELGGSASRQVGLLPFPRGRWRWRLTAPGSVKLRTVWIVALPWAPGLLRCDSEGTRQFAQTGSYLLPLTQDRPVTGVTASHHLDKTWAKEPSSLSWWRGPCLPHTVWDGQVHVGVCSSTRTGISAQSPATAGDQRDTGSRPQFMAILDLGHHHTSLAKPLGRSLRRSLDGRVLCRSIAGYRFVSGKKGWFLCSQWEVPEFLAVWDGQAHVGFCSSTRTRISPRPQPRWLAKHQVQCAVRLRY